MRRGCRLAAANCRPVAVNEAQSCVRLAQADVAEEAAQEQRVQHQLQPVAVSEAASVAEARCGGGTARAEGKRRTCGKTNGRGRASRSLGAVQTAKTGYATKQAVSSRRQA